MAEPLRYPRAARGKNSDYLQITAFSYKANNANTVNYQPSGLTDSSTKNLNQLLSAGGKGAKIIDSVIQLPMPSNIQDSQQVAYGEDSLDIFGATAGAQIMSGMTNVGSALGTGGISAALSAGSEFFQNSAKIIGGKGSVVQDAFTRNLAAQAAGILGANVTAQQLLTRTQGKIINPDMELLFTAPTLRAFQFSFKMSPRDADEKDEIKKIIRTFKQNMAPTNEGVEYLKTPNVFELQYKSGTENQPFLNRFKTCALTDMSVNYTGENVYATYNDGAPISMIMNLTFKELTPIYSSDYTDDPEGKIGVGY